MLNWRELPIVRPFLALAIGILLAVYFDYNHLWLQFSPILACLLFLPESRLRKQYRYQWVTGAIAFLFFGFFGYQVTMFHSEWSRRDHFSERLTQHDFLMGTVSEAPNLKPDWVKIQLRSRLIGTSSDSMHHCSGNVLLYVERDSLATQLAYGDELTIHGKITLVEQPKNPEAFDYARYLHFQNIHHQAFVRNGKWVRTAQNLGNPVYGLAIRWRDRFLGILQKHLHTEREFAVGSALILGYRDAVPEEVLTAYSETGAMHLLAVSGMHVGFIFYFFRFFLKRIHRKTLPWKIVKFVVPVLGIWAFALITGASASVMRAAVMFTFLIAGSSFQRYTNIYNTLAASALCLLVYNPYWLFDVGFQLSYLAVLGIVFFEPRITRLWLVENKILRFFWQINSVSLAAQLMTLPLTLFYFHQFPTYFWLSSLVLVPVSGLVLGVGLFLFFIESISSLLATGVGWVLWGMVWFSNEVIARIQHLPFSLFDGIWFRGWVVLIMFLALAGMMYALSSKKPRWVLVALGLLLVTGVNSAFVSWENTGKRQIVIYQLSKNTLIDFMDGRQAWSLASEGVPEKSVRFSAENYRMASGVWTVQPLLLNADTTLRAPQFFYQRGFAQFFEKRLAIVNRSLPAPGSSKIKIDYVLVCGSPKIEVSDILEVFDCQEIIFDGSNKFYKLKDWKAACEEAGVKCHFTAEEGAWVKNLAPQD